MLHLLYALLAAVADIASGVLAIHSRFLEVNQRYVVAFASGVVVSTAFLELLPKSDVGNNAIFVVLGFFTFYLIEKVMLLHACGEKECEAHTMGWTAVAGMASDNVVDGVGIAVAYFTDPAFGLIITVAVVLHEIPQGMASTALMQKTGYNVKKIFLVLALAGASYPLGALLAIVIPPELYIAIIAFVAGDFIYIGAGDLLGEAHKRFNYKVVLTTLLGALLFILIEALI